MDYYKKFGDFEKSLFETETIKNVEKCCEKPDTTFVDGYNTCLTCGVVDLSHCKYLTERFDSDYGYMEERVQKRCKYSRLGNIRKHLINYSITQQSEISMKTYFDLLQKIVRESPNIKIRRILDRENINHSHFFARLSEIQEKKKPLSLETIDKIIKIVSYYVSFYGVKHLNNKALVYVVALKTFNIDLSDYIQNMSPGIIDKYTTLYEDFVNKNKDCLFFK